MTYADGTEAVRGVSIAVAEGEFFGFLGPNGAGKTTTVRTLVTLLHPTAGTVQILTVTVLFGGVFMAYSTVVAVAGRDRDATIMLSNLLTFPLLFVSSAFVPLDALPGWIRAVAVVNPFTYGVDGIRALMLGRDVMTVLDVPAFGGLWNTLVPAVAILLGFNVVLGALAVRLLARAASAEVQ